jgi:hypothetical protein
MYHLSASYYFVHADDFQMKTTHPKTSANDKSVFFHYQVLAD